MQPDSKPDRTLVADNAAIAKLRRALTACDYTHDGLERTFGGERTPTMAEVPIALRRLPAGDPLSTIITLFLFGIAVDADQAAAALAPLTLRDAARIGLVAHEGDRVEPLVRLVPSGEMVFASDRDSARDQVMGVAPSSARIGNLTVRRPVERALDVGTGSGIQATLAARHARHVVATDVNDRALGFAAFNALLNGAPNVEFRQGSFFEPVAGERFDLIVSNPPFVVSPDLDFVYRDGSLPGHGVSEHMVRGAAEHLADGGLAHMLVTWTHEQGGDWSLPLRAWVEGSGCDALFLRYNTDDPLSYAARWNPPAQAADGNALGETIDRWLAYYRELGIEAIAYGAAILRRRDGANWVVAEDAPERMIGPAGDHVARLIEAQDFLARSDDLLGERLELVPGHVLEQALQLDGGAFIVQSAAIRLLDGLGFQATIDVSIGHLISRLDGRHTVRGAAADTAAEIRAGEISGDELAEQALPIVRRMVELGFLVRGIETAPPA